MLTVIVPTCSNESLEKFLPSFYKYCDANLVVVFNGEERQPKIPYGHCIYHPKRIGYTIAVNEAWDWINQPRLLSDGDMVAVVNDDVEFAGRCFEPLVDAIRRGAALAAPSVQPIGRDGLWARSGEPYRWVFAEGWLFVTTAGWIRRAGEIAPMGMMVPQIYDAAFTPAYCEDCDFSIRLYEAGGKIFKVPVPAIHRRSQTFSKLGPLKDLWWSRSREYLIAKWRLDTIA